jgi:hypothetical protein
MEPISPLTDFSFDFQDLRLQRRPEQARSPESPRAAR